MVKKLYIIAAGLSSRMGGNPKHICCIGSKRNIENTIELAVDAGYDNIYIVINKNLKSEYKGITNAISDMFDNTKIIEIESGQGDAHAISEAFNVNDEKDNVTVVWGDTYFLNKNAFEKSIKNLDNIDFINVFCAYEYNPYCYATLDNIKYKGIAKINNMGFRSESSNPYCEYKWHDQSMFNINSKMFKKIYNGYISYINAIKNYIKIKDFEYSIIKLINWNSQYNKYSCVDSKCICLDSIISKSFNTQEELIEILEYKEKLNNK